MADNIVKLWTDLDLTVEDTIPKTISDAQGSNNQLYMCYRLRKKVEQEPQIKRTRFPYSLKNALSDVRSPEPILNCYIHQINLLMEISSIHLPPSRVSVVPRSLKQILKPRTLEYCLGDELLETDDLLDELSAESPATGISSNNSQSTIGSDESSQVWDYKSPISSQQSSASRCPSITKKNNRDDTEAFESHPCIKATEIGLRKLLFGSSLSFTNGKTEQPVTSLSELCPAIFIPSHYPVNPNIPATPVGLSISTNGISRVSHNEQSLCQ